MRLITFTIAIILTILTISCNSSSKQSKSEATIELNNGQKWTINSEMTPYILEAEQILNQNNNSDYKSLAGQLEVKNKNLIKSCTMNGKSHDELHKWLHPHIQLVKALDDAKNEQEANQIIDKLKKSFQTFNTYFQ